ncbi:MAG: hypothetical protein OMM_12030 [Candidatus Magnetoglobus multicellularis str. Araruama]|uniref:Uncharacterized protein n=1 Tax=Candidatus Magnetoglobus multicellularis str. Araruama TaxID=890399 RepID=A0A1V1NWV8_9BACT|nr:MAG: hypothetical protein OMM_12030 [Candidatus Magnetoglobus multicellularis str. Araruama]
MIKKAIIGLFVIIGIVSNAFSSNYISLIIPDSPIEYQSNTWYENNWTEIDISNEASIKDWFIVYTWITDDYPGDASFHVLSPSGTKLTIASAAPGGTWRYIHCIIRQL